MISAGSRVVILVLFCTLIWVFFEPALANKFETIGGGVSGSSKMKVEYLKVIALVVGGIFLLASVLAVVTHNQNAHTLNYTTWRSSAIVLFLLSLVSFAAGVFI